MKRKSRDATPAAVAGGAVTTLELLTAMGSIRRARKILRPYVAGLFSQTDFTLERVDVCLAEAQLRLEEIGPKPPPAELNDKEETMKATAKALKSLEAVAGRLKKKMTGLEDLQRELGAVQRAMAELRRGTVQLESIDAGGVVHARRGRPARTG